MSRPPPEHSQEEREPGPGRGTGTAPHPTAWDWAPFPRDCLRCGTRLGPGLGSVCEACGWKETDE